jgi:hypothetical protein
MSGTAALASARRRIAIPQKLEVNEVIDAPKQQAQPQQPLATNPGMLLLKHNQQISLLQNEVDSLKKRLEETNTPKNKDDKESLEYYKTQHLVLLEEMREVKKTLLKVQTFSMETNLELMKLKKTSSKSEPVLDFNEPDNR